MSIPVPPWISTIGSLSPLVLGILGIIIGRKTKTARDEIRIKDLQARVKELEDAQADHTIVIATIQTQIEFIQDQFSHIESVGDITSAMVMEVRGMLYGMNNQVPPPIQIPVRRVPLRKEMKLA
jgi:hypothetical protein